MQKDLLENISTGKVYTIKTIVTCTSLGGLLASGYMLYKNFKVFEDNKKASWTIVLTLLTLVGIISISFIPILENVPNIVYSILITLATSFLAKKHQEDLIILHKEKNGATHTVGNAVLVCVISIALIFVPVLLFFLLQDLMV